MLQEGALYAVHILTGANLGAFSGIHSGMTYARIYHCPVWLQSVTINYSAVSLKSLPDLRCSSGLAFLLIRRHTPRSLTQAETHVMGVGGFAWLWLHRAFACPAEKSNVRRRAPFPAKQNVVSLEKTLLWKPGGATTNCKRKHTELDWFNGLIWY